MNSGRRISAVVGLVVAVGLSLGLATTASAELTARSEQCALDNTQLRRFLDDQASRTRTWNLAWGTVFTVAAVGEYSMLAAGWSPLGEWNDDVRAGTLAGGIKASVGVVSKVFLPLRAVRPAAETGDPCVDLAVAETALALAAKRQKRAFYMNHFGGLAVNLAGVLALGLWADSWKQGAISFAIGAPIGIFSTYTMPRGAWKTARRRAARDVAMAPVVAPGFAGLVLATTF